VIYGGFLKDAPGFKKLGIPRFASCSLLPILNSINTHPVSLLETCFLKELESSMFYGREYSGV
jgi:hypothetical protein